MIGYAISLAVAICFTTAYLEDRVDYYTGKEHLTPDGSFILMLITSCSWGLFYYLTHK